jgi:hypothetical protein
MHGVELVPVTADRAQPIEGLFSSCGDAPGCGAGIVEAYPIDSGRKLSAAELYTGTLAAGPRLRGSRPAAPRPARSSALRGTTGLVDSAALVEAVNAQRPEEGPRLL